MSEAGTTKRIESIDIVRGLAMIIMALDHVRDYIHITANTDDPLNLATTSPWLYFTRWITHFCAPVFVFLSGTSIYLQSFRKSPKELGVFVMKRGLWLIIAEFLIISLAWTYNPLYNLIPFQVIWAIGISMLMVGLLIYFQLPYWVFLSVGLFIVCGHNALDFIESTPGFQPGFWWDFLHSGYFKPYPYADNRVILMVYAFPVWTAVMMLGYCLGPVFNSQMNSESRNRILTRMGLILIAGFVIIRMTNLYGDPEDWSIQRNPLYTILSFIKVDKYPASLLYLMITLGPALILLAKVEGIKNIWTDRVLVFGRTAFFYYILHLYLIHLIATIFFYAEGNTLQEWFERAPGFPFLFLIPGEGYSLWVVYAVWICVILILYPLCRWYDRYKTNHKEKWWLSYI